ncbi:MAG TPA: lipopolysaccharide transport periplasmic protein LptA [Gammaproteobacteria bacterium]|jgi:lipopolysaccharide export system protein LptA|nr:lipopolysaccharide transport periplasmic protein LptA [Gammaproteobacteria bacterium]HIF86146.1 lipopolysaccharide transport periplasmic protein LptA [Gammaproteobacteria bacterium]HIL62505.1 lipopolysaccharide transport periplasmic protein LptA [Porticoccaceae bacterium]HIN89789.1 lipopolysaccharide transport periplasmic protein LptA [Porticoccaceae bacterium]HIO75809.1 lipopolysaccharide transport periplasmic protein LptA [Gammaproteobacteria bacterium]
MSLHSNNTGAIAIFSLCGLISMSAFALESDKDQDVAYTADGDLKMMTEDNRRVVTMNNNVKVTQGSLQITGDMAIFEYDLTSKALLKVTVNGSPARYQQQLDEEGDLVQGDSETIHYSTNLETIIEFIGDANLRQPGTTTSCVAIKYFADTELFETTGPCSGILSSQSN